MTLTAIVLVFASALLHALWNLLLKRVGGGQVVVGLSKVAEVAVFLPFFLVAFGRALPPASSTLMFTGVAAIGVLVNYLALARAYAHGDLSFVYPISRGAILVFLPVIGWLALGERISPLAGVALVTIVIGILVLPLVAFDRDAPRALWGALRTRATAFALLAALTGAAYTIWDKRAVQQLPPFVYMYLYTLWVACVYCAWIWARVPRNHILEAWRRAPKSIVAIGVFNTLSYLLTLLALKSGVSSYVLGLRQLSIAAGVLLGWRVLREPVSIPRAGGVVLIVLGCLLLTVASRR